MYHRTKQDWFGYLRCNIGCHILAQEINVRVCIFSPFDLEGRQQLRNQMMQTKFVHFLLSKWRHYTAKSKPRLSARNRFVYGLKYEAVKQPECTRSTAVLGIVWERTVYGGKGALSCCVLFTDCRTGRKQSRLIRSEIGLFY